MKESSKLQRSLSNAKDQKLSLFRKKISLFQRENEDMATAVERLVSFACYEALDFSSFRDTKSWSVVLIDLLNNFF